MILATISRALPYTESRPQSLRDSLWGALNVPTSTHCAGEPLWHKQPSSGREKKSSLKLAGLPTRPMMGPPAGSAPPRQGPSLLRPPRRMSARARSSIERSAHTTCARWSLASAHAATSTKTPRWRWYARSCTPLAPSATLPGLDLALSTRAPGLPGREYVRLDRENAGF